MMLHALSRRAALSLIALASALPAWGQTAKPPPAKPAAPKPPAPPRIERDPATLPAPVARMRERILEAARAGDIEAMRIPIEVNELPPMFKREGRGDPLALLRSLSADPEGFDILARLVNVLEQGYAVTDPGTPRAVHVFPWFAVVAPETLTPADRVEAHRIVPPAVMAAWRETKVYAGDRLAIGPDGTWHWFLAGK